MLKEITKTTKYISTISALKLISLSFIIEDYFYVENKELDITNTNKSNFALLEKVINNALSDDFEATLKLAVELVEKYNIYYLPQIIMVYAAIHPLRELFTKSHPSSFYKYETLVMKTGESPLIQLTYFLLIKGSKNSLPNILKKSIAKKLNSLSSDEIGIYKNKHIGMINACRICHASSEAINTLMTKGSIKAPKTIQTFLIKNKSWHYIYSKMKINHALTIKYLESILKEKWNDVEINAIAKHLTNSVRFNPLLPYEYYFLYSRLLKRKSTYLNNIIPSLVKCFYSSIKKLPTLNGKTICITDNSLSTSNIIDTPFGKTNIAHVGNICSVINSIRNNSDESYVCVFGERFKIIHIDKKEDLLKQVNDIGTVGQMIGKNYKTGILEFFNKIINEQIMWDNIFIYTDIDFTNEGQDNKITSKLLRFIDKYRRINPYANIFIIQTFCKNKILLPQYGYRLNILFGWTGKELHFANEIIKTWNEIDYKKKK